MNFTEVTLALLFSIGMLGIEQLLPVKAQADDILFKVQLPGTNYCHLKFPSIREETLSSSRPVLSDTSKDPRTGDIIDFYGSCDYDPTGKEAVQRQRIDRQQRWTHAYAS